MMNSFQMFLHIRITQIAQVICLLTWGPNLCMCNIEGMPMIYEHVHLIIDSMRCARWMPNTIHSNRSFDVSNDVYFLWRKGFDMFATEHIKYTLNRSLMRFNCQKMSSRLVWNIFCLLWPGHFIFLFPSRMVEPLNGWKYDQWYQTIILTIIFFHNSTNYSRINKNTGKCRLLTDFPGLCKMMIWCAIAVANK